jgi:hypothetical protein
METQVLTDLMPYFLGVGTGALAILLPWVQGPYKKYVLNCGKVTCPHHTENAKRLQDINDKTRNGPTRPDIR